MWYRRRLWSSSPAEVSRTLALSQTKRALHLTVQPEFAAASLAAQKRSEGCAPAFLPGVGCSGLTSSADELHHLLAKPRQVRRLRLGHT